MMLSPENSPRIVAQSEACGAAGSTADRMSSAMMMFSGVASVTRPLITPLTATRPFT